ERGGAERDPAPGDPRDVEEVVHEAHEQAGLPLDDLALAQPRVAEAKLEELERAHQRRERVAELVAQHGEELVLRPVRDPLPLEQVLALRLGGPQLADALAQAALYALAIGDLRGQHPGV